MTDFVELLPHMGQTTVDDVLSLAVRTADNPLPVGSVEARNYCADLSRRLLTNPKTQKFAELQALGFWLRPASIEAVVRTHLSNEGNLYRAPAGIVLQLPPSNVEALFGYTATLSLLCGNVTLVRLSGSGMPAQIALANAMTDAMQEAAPNLKDRLFLLRYDHDDVITDHLSSVCDTRLVWGSNETVEHIRRIALPPLARHVSFGDRFSAAAIKAESYCAAPENKKEELVQQFFNDVYWFDQQACSSPRLFTWIGGKEISATAAEDFFPRLGAYATERGYQPGTGENIAKLNASFLAMHDLPVQSYKTFSPALSLVELDNLYDFKKFKDIAIGYGMLVTTRHDTLEDFAHFAERRDQTLGLWGFEKAEIRAFADLCRGRGFDRLVPIGQALAFAPVWDGCNMFDLMTRLIQVDA